MNKHESRGQCSADLEEDTADAPHVHLVRVIAVCEQALWRSVPSSGDVLSVGLLGVDAPAAAKICQLKALINDQNVFWLDVPVNKHCWLSAANMMRVQ